MPTQTNPGLTRARLSLFSYRHLDELFAGLGRQAEQAIREGDCAEAERLLEERRKVQLEVQVRHASFALVSAIGTGSDLALELARHDKHEAEAELAGLCEERT